MSTRGLYGFRKNGIDKTSYNHCDSYPEWLGEQIVRFCRDVSIDDMNEFCEKIQMVSQDGTPSDEMAKLYNGRAGEDWYGILRNLQGDLDALYHFYRHNGVAHMTDDHEFIYDSLWCEHAYIINLDTNKLEYYVGFQKKPDASGRYQGVPQRFGYYPCKLAKEFDLNEASLKNAVHEMNNAMKMAYTLESF